MAKKRNPLEDPPTASSSDDDEMETSGAESEEVSSSDDEETKDPAVKPPSSAVTIAVPGKPTVSAAAVPSAAKEASDSDSGSETETDSDEETERQSNPPPNQGSVKSLAVTSVPAACSAAKPKKKEAEAASTALALSAAKSGTKRPSEGTSREANSKRAKKVTSAGDDEKKIGEDSKKPAFQRLWTEDDEIAILQGMIDFKADKGKSPYEDTTAYYDFIKGSISFEVSKNQFMDKLRSLKKKYMNKEKPSFTKPHDQKSHKLCKYIWGSDGLALESAVKSNGVSKKSSQKKTKKLDSVKQELVFASPNGKQKAAEDDGGNSKKVAVLGGDDVVSLAVAVKKPDWFENSFLVRAIAGFGVDESYVKQRWSLVPVETKKKIEEKVKVLQGKEFEFVLEKTEFLHEVTSMIAEATKNKPLDI